MESKKFTTIEELSTLKDINNQLISIEIEIGKLEILKQLNAQKHFDLQKKSSDFSMDLAKKYGDCQVNLESGEITIPLVS